MTEKMSPVAKNFGQALRSARRASENLTRAMGFKNQVRNAHDALKGRVIKEVVGEETPTGKTVRVICEDGMEFVAQKNFFKMPHVRHFSIFNFLYFI
ncbi:MAG: hypothetical protein HYT27_01490 [Parcubacteria group bacterium]|nr:hypothetical protein [Parcubacteria group bacterium]